MKKLFSIILIAVTLFSCSNDDNNVVPPTVLQKVVFYKNSPNERHWNISNNLLSTITLPDGTIVEQFVYDSQNRVISDIKYANSVITETNTITYNADNTIKTINNLPYTYDAATKTYAYSYGSNFTINCQVNSDFLVENFVRTGTNAGEYHMTYANGDMTSFEKSTNGTSDIIKNFHFYPDGTSTNRIYTAVLAVARVKSLTDPNFFIDGQASFELANGFDKGTTDPYYYNYGELPDMDGKLYQIGIEVLDSSNNFVDFYSFAEYHYQ